MLEMCAPSWIERESEYGDVREALLSCLGTRTPAVWSYESIGKNAYGTLCEVKMKVLPRGKDRESGSWDLRKVRLLLEDGKWYIDPPSLRIFMPEDARVFSLENLFVPEDEEGKADQAAVRESFDTFFRWWSSGLLKETEPGVYRMDPEVKNGLLGLCLPSWVKAQEDPASELLRILGMKAPVKQLVNVHFLPDGGSVVSGMIYTDRFGRGESYRSYPMQACRTVSGLTCRFTPCRRNRDLSAYPRRRKGRRCITIPPAGCITISTRTVKRSAKIPGRCRDSSGTGRSAASPTAA